ncbi:MAG: hypothetical protein BWY99_02056 [Synergistetes bacterium ADurb.BinA166]|nr:MAG: hypothetical protein BWY99_02056 [Synergistetes bacterium ADurb.BinA166]
MPKPITGTPWVSSTSSVRPMSRMDFAPAQTTATGVRASSIRSAEMSKVCCAPLCTPPMPPVANTRTPASDAPIIVLATVVAPSPPLASSIGRSRLLALRTSDERPMCSSSSSLSPTRITPPIIAIVAGVAPSSRMMRSQVRALSTFSG